MLIENTNVVLTVPLICDHFTFDISHITDMTTRGRRMLVRLARAGGCTTLNKVPIVTMLNAKYSEILKKYF